MAGYKQPVLVYLPPMDELRGGLGGAGLAHQRARHRDVLCRGRQGQRAEPTGVVGLKFRKSKLLQTMHRLDLALMALDERLRKFEKLPPNDKVAATELLKESENGERGLFPVYIVEQDCAHVRAAAQYADHGGCGGGRRCGCGST